MNNKFDELTKSMAQSVTRRAALKKFGVGLAGMALACFGLANRTRAATWNGYCQVEPVSLRFKGQGKTSWVPTGMCIAYDATSNSCSLQTDYNCLNATQGSGKPGPCGYWNTKYPCSF